MNPAWPAFFGLAFISSRLANGSDFEEHLGLACREKKCEEIEIFIPYFSPVSALKNKPWIRGQHTIFRTLKSTWVMMWSIEEETNRMARHEEDLMQQEKFV